ncbi:MAG: hypothetical protein LBQ12_11095 [Deltaproteobacteria bacterium]|jgi:methyl-accepting chemotaxis protein|nr:hypothetical protein [Deltaproteobacteria bacterium]
MVLSIRRGGAKTVSNPNDATLNGPFDGLADVSEQGGVWAAIHKSLQAPHSAEKTLVLKEFAQALKEVAPEALAAGAAQLPKKTVSVETLAARVSMLTWFIGVFSTIVVAVVIGFLAFSQSNVGRLDTRIGGLEAKVEARMGSLDARMGSLDARMDNFYGKLMDLQKDFAKMQASQDHLKASLDEVKASQDRMQATLDEMKASLNR